jgi:hypothetical protein
LMFENVSCAANLLLFVIVASIKLSVLPWASG